MSVYIYIYIYINTYKLYGPVFIYAFSKKSVLEEKKLLGV